MLGKSEMKAALIVAVIFVSYAGTANAVWVWTPETGRWVNPANQPKETPEAQLEYASQLRLAGDYEEALGEYEKFFKFYPDSDLCPQAQFQIGELYEARGDYERASKEYQKVVSNWRASGLFDKVVEKQYEIADRFYQEEMARTRRFRLFRGRYLRRAIRIYEQVIENAPFGPAAAQAQYRIAECHFASGHYLEATYEYRKVLDEYPSSEWAGQAMYGLGMCYYEQALPAEYDQTIARKAVEQFRLFTGLYPDDPKTQDATQKIADLREEMARQQLVVAAYYEKIQRSESASVYYRTVVAKYPGTQAADEAKEKLEAGSGQ
jgi:outer membrane assembly lipoprotein YfiO